MSTASPTTDVDSLYEQSMKLTPQQRLELGERIIDSVPMFKDQEEEEKLATIVERRWQEIVEGKVQTIPGDEVFRRIRERLDRRDRERDAQ
jgi:putative addiction module component (TIGR02574 family)